MTFRLLLASESPRRKTLLQEAGFTFEVYSPCIEEKVWPDWTPEVCVRKLAEQKALAVIDRLRKEREASENDDDTLVLAADTVVAIGNEALGKPRDFQDAYRMLWRLSRSTHRVLTGVCLWPLSWDHGLCDVEVTHVTMRPMSDQEIRAYVESGESMGKAGAYAIQETADRYVERLEGPLDNVVGLPVDLVVKLIGQWNEERKSCKKTGHLSTMFS